MPEEIKTGEAVVESKVEPKKVIEEDGKAVEVYEDKLIFRETIPETIKKDEVLKESLLREKEEIEENIKFCQEGIIKYGVKLEEINKKLAYFNE